MDLEQLLVVLGRECSLGLSELVLLVFQSFNVSPLLSGCRSCGIDTMGEVLKRAALGGLSRIQTASCCLSTA